MSKKNWPKDETKTVDIEDLIKQVRTVLERTHDITPKKLTGRVPWTGFKDTGPVGRACAPTHVSEILSPKSLEYHAERGRDLLEMILLVAVRLGLEQGRRYQLSECGWIHHSHEVLMAESRKRQAEEDTKLTPEEKEARKLKMQKSLRALLNKTDK